MKTTIIIPAYNEAKTIGIVVSNILKIGKNLKILVVNDGSNDETGTVAKKFGAQVINLTLNSGSGAAIATGLKSISINKDDAVILLDADGQHDPKYIPQLISEISNGVDYVIGSRYMLPTPSSTTLIRRTGTRIISIFIKIFYGKTIYDPTSGYRAMNRNTLKFLKNRYPTTFSEPEVIMDLITNGYKIGEISVVMNPRIYGQSSITLKKAIGLMVYIILKIMSRYKS